MDKKCNKIKAVAAAVVNNLHVLHLNVVSLCACAQHQDGSFLECHSVVERNNWWPSLNNEQYVILITGTLPSNINNSMHYSIPRGEWMKKSACMFFLTIHYMSSGVVITCAICWIVNSDSIVTDAACLCYHHCTSAPERVQIRWLRALLFRYTPEQWTHLQSNKSKPKKMKTKVLKTIKISRVRRIVQECLNPKRTRI